MIDKIEMPSILIKHRKRMGLSQQAMSERFGMTRARWASYEEGRAFPSIYDLILISQKMGYKSLDHFLEIKPVEGLPKVIVAYNKLSKEKKEIVDFILGL